MTIRVVELFAGVGGFRQGLPPPHFRTVWSNQWEPGERGQWASQCYVKNFGPDGHSNADITTIDPKTIPDHDLLVGGFPCQDYSVATTKAAGIKGKKGVLWWAINDILIAKKPSYVLLENVDRLLRSPTSQRGRDFAIVLRCLNDAGYHVEWRALNAADYGFPQKRRRVFIFAAHKTTPWGRFISDLDGADGYLRGPGFFARAFPVEIQVDAALTARVTLPPSLQMISDEFGFRFMQSGVAIGGKVLTEKPSPIPVEPKPLRTVLERNVSSDYYVPKESLGRWQALKGAKAEMRTSASGHTYHYSEGSIPFPDNLDQPARTILTQEGAKSPSRFNHLIYDPETGEPRRLTPEEVENLNGFPPGWTLGMPERRRYFCMGNALVVGIVHRIGETLHSTYQGPSLGAKSLARGLRLHSRPTLTAPPRARPPVQNQTGSVAYATNR